MFDNRTVRQSEHIKVTSYTTFITKSQEVFLDKKRMYNYGKQAGSRFQFARLLQQLSSHLVYNCGQAITRSDSFGV